MTDLRQPFYDAEERHRAEIERLVRALSDEELADVAELFAGPRNSVDGLGGLATVPARYWGIAPKVRAHIHAEQKRRRENADSE